MRFEICGQGDASEWNEKARVAALRDYEVLDTAPEQSFDDLAALAARICHAPAAFVSFVEEKRQWFKAAVGMDVRETPREVSICSVAIRSGGLFVVPDTKEDPRFRDLSSIAGQPTVRFYAGAVLERADGLRLGTLCVWDFEPRPDGLTEEQASALSALARAVLAQLALRTANTALQKALAENEHRTVLFDTALTKLKKGLCFFDGDQRLIACNDRYRAIYGLTSDQTRVGVSAREIIDHIHRSGNGPDMPQAEFLRIVQETAADTKPGDRLVKLGKRTVAIHYEPMPNGGWVSTHEDITNELETQSRIQAADERFRLAAKATRDVIWDWNLATDHVVFGQSACETLGYDKDQIGTSGQWWLSAIHPDDRSRVEETVRASISCGDEIWRDEYRFRRGDGTYADVFDRGFIIRDQNSAGVRMVGAMQDVSERTEAQRTLREGEERLRLALNAGRMFAWDRDLGSDFTRRSENAMAMLGLGSGPSSQLLDKVHPDDLARVRWALQNLDDGLSDFEFRCVRPNGETVWLSFRANRPTADRLIGVAIDITERKEAEAAIRRLADEDPLTGLPNRRRFSACLQEALDEAKLKGTCVHLLVIDLDDFKDVNDTLGHDAGDALLKETAQRLQRLAPVLDTVARIGGDEFAMLLSEPFTPENALRFAEHVVDVVRAPFSYEGRLMASSVSIGVAAYPDDGSQPDLMKAADLALYDAKAIGRSRVIRFSPQLRRAAEERVAILSRVREGLEADEFVPFYQPKISFSTGRIVGFEALARWQHPVKGILTPGYFGAAFAHSELSEVIGQMMLRKVATDMSAWREQHIAFGRVALNFSSSEFVRPDLAETVLAVLAEHDVACGQFEVEVTEGVFMGATSANVLGILQRFKRAGVKVALDDFGTGFASLTHLKQFPVDHIKIDRSFVQGLGMEQGDEAIVSSVVGLAKNLGMEVTAEGVETEAQALRLGQLGCDFGQGYLFGKPMAGSRVPWFVANWGRQEKDDWRDALAS